MKPQNTQLLTLQCWSVITAFLYHFHFWTINPSWYSSFILIYFLGNTHLVNVILFCVNNQLLFLPCFPTHFWPWLELVESERTIYLSHNRTQQQQ